jgi:hypothetical protein
MGKTLKQYRFDVQGGGAQPYTVLLTIAPLTISCTCASAYINQPCKHRIAMLKGDDPGFVSMPENHMDILQAAKQEAEAIGVFQALDAYQKIKAEKSALSKTTDGKFKEYKEALISQKGEEVLEKSFNKMNEAIIAEIPIQVQFEKISADLNTVFIRHNTDVLELVNSIMA